MQIEFLADRPNLIQGLAPAIWKHWRTELPEDTTLEHRVEKLQNHLHKAKLPLAFVAHQNGKALGTAALRTQDLDERTDLSPWLGGVFVLPEHRGQGIASALCRAATVHANAMGHPVLYLFTADKKSLYERLGWRTIESATWRGLCGSIMSIKTESAHQQATPCLRAPA